MPDHDRAPPLFEGSLRKRARHARLKNWRTRHFRLYADRLSYFKNASAPEPRGVLPIDEHSHVTSDMALWKRFPNSFVVEGAGHESLLLIAPDPDSRRAWMEKIAATIDILSLPEELRCEIQRPQSVEDGRSSLEVYDDAVRVARGEAPAARRRSRNHVQERFRAEAEEIARLREASRAPRKSTHAARDHAGRAIAGFVELKRGGHGSDGDTSEDESGPSGRSGGRKARPGAGAAAPSQCCGCAVS